MHYSDVQEPLISASDLNHDLQTISTWKMEFNPGHNKQAVEILFSQKINVVYHPSLLFNNSVVCKVNSHEHDREQIERTCMRNLDGNVSLIEDGVGVLYNLTKYVTI